MQHRAKKRRYHPPILYTAYTVTPTQTPRRHDRLLLPAPPRSSMTKPTLFQRLLNAPSQSYSFPAQEKNYHSTKATLLKIAIQDDPAVCFLSPYIRITHVSFPGRSSPSLPSLHIPLTRSRRCFRRAVPPLLLSLNPPTARQPLRKSFTLLTPPPIQSSLQPRHGNNPSPPPLRLQPTPCPRTAIL